MFESLSILLIEPYFGGSHRQWALGYQRHSQYEVEILSLPAQLWKWRMQGGAVTLARRFLDDKLAPDVIFASDMMDVSLFRSITRTHIPIALYFHENQLSYPQNTRQTHGWQYGFINYASALASDKIYFNSKYHLENFFEFLPRMLKHFGDFNELQSIEVLQKKASVLPPGLNLTRFDDCSSTQQSLENEKPIILWNHRWETDKNPSEFFQVLYMLVNNGFDFQLIVTGENVRQLPIEFEEAQQRLGDRIIHWGFVENFSDYMELLWRADYVVSTAHQEFFGVSISEAIYCGCIPIMPKRLNYPYLIPDSMHHCCLYPERKLFRLLSHHLVGKFEVDIDHLKSYISQFDWSKVAPQYDSALATMLSC